MLCEVRFHITKFCVDLSKGEVYFHWANLTIIKTLKVLKTFRVLSGEGGIRTLGRPEPTIVFETIPFSHSGTSPNIEAGEIITSFCILARAFLHFPDTARQGRCARHLRRAPHCPRSEASGSAVSNHITNPHSHAGQGNAPGLDFVHAASLSRSWPAFLRRGQEKFASQNL